MCTAGINRFSVYTLFESGSQGRYKAALEIGLAIHQEGYTLQLLNHLTECITRHGTFALQGLLDGLRLWDKETSRCQTN